MAAQLPAHLRLVRWLLRRLNYHLSSASLAQLPPEPFDPGRLKQAEEALRHMPSPDPGAKAYLEKHIPPPGANSGAGASAAVVFRNQRPRAGARLLHADHALAQRLCGYQEVRGAYFGAGGPNRPQDRAVPGWRVRVRHRSFRLRPRPFPVSRRAFRSGVAGEIIEHLTWIPCT